MSSSPADPSPETLPEIAEEELDQIKCAQREEQDRHWEQMTEEEQKKLREELFPAIEGDLEPLPLYHEHR